MASSRALPTLALSAMIAAAACSSGPPPEPAGPTCAGSAPMLTCFAVWPTCCDEPPRYVEGVCTDRGWDCPPGTYDNCSCGPPPADASLDAAVDAGADAAPPPADAAHTDAGLCPAPAGMGCTYVNIPGVARITSITDDVAAGDYACMNEPRRVLFDFVPERAELTACYAHPETLDTAREYRIFAGAHPSLECVEALGLEVGDELPAVRRDITAGSCTPVLFQLMGDTHGTTCAPPVCQF